MRFFLRSLLMYLCCAGLFMISNRSAVGEAVALLINRNGDKFSFRVAGEDGNEDWLLQFT